MTRLARGITLLAFILLCTAAPAQDEKKKKEPRRFGFDVDETTFAQATPAAAMKSIGLALDRKKVDYLLAHMTDPNYVDYWVDRYKIDFPEGKEEGKRLLAFDRLVRETNDYFRNDPLIVKDLRTFAREAKWEEKDDIAVGVVEANPEKKLEAIPRKVFLKKIGDRWFLKNEQQ